VRSASTLVRVAALKVFSLLAIIERQDTVRLLHTPVQSLRGWFQVNRRGLSGPHLLVNVAKRIGIAMQMETLGRACAA
jgi:hypothetical protein